jgi:hypothetical protein
MRESLRLDARLGQAHPAASEADPLQDEHSCQVVPNDPLDGAAADDFRFAFVRETGAHFRSDDSIHLID